MILRPYQQETLRKIKYKLDLGVTKHLVKYATGLGKTPLFASLPSFLTFHDNDRMLVLAHTDELVTQAAEKLTKWNPGRSIGIEKAERIAGDAHIVVASVQTLGKAGSSRIEKFSRDAFRVVVVDEAHHAVASTYRRILDYFDTALHIGVTATVNRADGEGLGQVFQEIIDDKDILFGVKEGWLADPRGRRFRTDVNLDGVHTLAGDFNKGELGSTVNTPQRNDLIARSYLQYGEDRQAVYFTVDIDHAEQLAKAFKIYGVAAEPIYGDDPYRSDKLAAHRAGHIKVLCNAQLLTEGYDDWRVALIGIARPTKSEGLYTQMIGRGTRIPDDITNLNEARAQGVHIAKQDCLVFDYVDATTKHSLVTLPTLFGMGQEMDLRGRSLVAVLAEIDKIKEKRPYIDLTQVDDIANLKTYVQNVDLLKVTFAPEVIQLSEYQWHKTGDNAYVLLLADNESVSIVSDILGRWHLIGSVNGSPLNKSYNTFEEAIREGDYQVAVFGGKSKTLAKRKASWHDESPTDGQLRMAKWYKIPVLPGTTRGELHLKINQVMAAKKKDKQPKPVEV